MLGDLVKSKFLLGILSLFLYSCDFYDSSHLSTVEKTSGKQITESQVLTRNRMTNTAPITNGNCIQTEGDYLTTNYCINITNIPGKLNEFPVPILMKIHKLWIKDQNYNSILANGWWGIYEASDKEKQYNQYGYKATAGDRYYEIDWSKEPTYFRIWNKDRTKLIEEEPVIKGPESLVKE